MADDLPKIGTTMWLFGPELALEVLYCLQKANQGVVYGQASEVLKKGDFDQV